MGRRSGYGILLAVVLPSPGLHVRRRPDVRTTITETTPQRRHSQAVRLSAGEVAEVSPRMAHQLQVARCITGTHWTASWRLARCDRRRRPRGAAESIRSAIRDGTFRLPGEELEYESVGVRARHRLECDLLCTLAGPEAERLFLGRSDLSGAHRDHCHCADIALALSAGDEREASAYLRWLDLRARRLVRLWWEDIERVAELLMQRPTLAGTEVRSVVERRPLRTTL